MCRHLFVFKSNVNKFVWKVAKKSIIVFTSSNRFVYGYFFRYIASFLLKIVFGSFKSCIVDVVPISNVGPGEFKGKSSIL